MPCRNGEVTTLLLYVNWHLQTMAMSRDCFSVQFQPCAGWMFTFLKALWKSMSEVWALKWLTSVEIEESQSIATIEDLVESYS